ncbi:MAG: hypothetical protein M4579_000028 [Chaenotheca gracillima]|nr:MAG: hypothetical protein M4579_000028 [Chaenotheca gracillima]
MASPQTEHREQFIVVKDRRSSCPATPEDLLNWMVEFAMLIGKAGLQGTTSTERFSSLFEVNADFDRFSVASVSDFSDLSSVLGGTIRDCHREKWLSKTLADHRALGPQVDALVKSRLAALEVPKEEYERASIPQNVERLSTSSIPKSPAIPTFKVNLMISMDPWGQSKKKLLLHFENNVTIQHFRAVLSDLSRPQFSLLPMSSKVDKGNVALMTGLELDSWVYKLLDSQMQLDSEASLLDLKHDDEFREVLRLLKKKGGQSAVIWHTTTFRLLEDHKISRQRLLKRKAASRNGHHAEPLDVDGTPYFDDHDDEGDGKGAIDWSLLSKISVGGTGPFSRPAQHNGNAPD